MSPENCRKHKTCGMRATLLTEIQAFGLRGTGRRPYVRGTYRRWLPGIATSLRNRFEGVIEALASLARTSPARASHSLTVSSGSTRS